MKEKEVIKKCAYPCIDIFLTINIYFPCTNLKEGPMYHCTKYYRSMADGYASEELKQQYAIHHVRKDAARQEKERDKQLAKAHSNICNY